MAISSMDGLVAGIVAGQMLPINKVSVASTAATWESFWTTAGQPGAGAIPATGAGAVPTNATAGAIPITDATGGATAYVAAVAGACGNAGQLVFYDRLVHTSGLDGTVTTSQTVNSAAITRPDALGDGVEAWVECYAALGATARTLTVTYTNQAGTGSRTGTVAIPASMKVAAMLPVALQAGDTGVRSVESAILSGSTGTAGNFGFTLLRRVAAFTLDGSFGLSLDAFDLGLPKIEAGACLALLMLCQTTATGILIVTLKTAKG